MPFGDVFAGWQEAAKQHYNNLLALDYQNKQSLASSYAKMADDAENYSPEQRTEFARRALKIHTLEPGKKLPKEWENMTIQVQKPSAPPVEQNLNVPAQAGAPVGIQAPEIGAPTPPPETRDILQPMSGEEKVAAQRPLAEEKARLAGVTAGEVAKAQEPVKERERQTRESIARIKQETDLAKQNRRPIYDANGYYTGSEAIPLAELPATQQSIIEKNKASNELSKSKEELNRATAEWNKSRADPNSPVNQRMIASIDMARRRVAISEAMLGLRNADEMAKLYGTDTQGNTLPGAIIDPETGQPVGTAFQRFYGPTAATLTRTSLGRNVLSQGQSMLQFAADPANAQVFGKEGGLRAWLSGKIGTNDPRLSGIAAQIESISSFLTGMHGARGAALAEGFKNTLRNVDSAEAFEAAVQQYMDAAERLTSEGSPHRTAAPTAPPNAPKTTPNGKPVANPPKLPNQASSGEIKVQGPGGTLVYSSDGHFLRVE